MDPRAEAGKSPRTYVDNLSAFGWICFGVCVTSFLLAYVTGLRADGVSGRVGIVVDPEAPQAQWRYKPAADQEVLVVWMGKRTLGLMQSRGYCAGTQVVRTDRDGRFDADGWWESPGWPPPRVDFASASPLVPGMVRQDFRYPSEPPADYTVILGPPPADSALALMFVDQLSAARLAEQAGCPPPRQH
jgi:hypothetical protein